MSDDFLTQSHIISVFLFIILGIWHFYWLPTATQSNKSLVSGISNYQQCQKPKERREDKLAAGGQEDCRGTLSAALTSPSAA